MSDGVVTLVAVSAGVLAVGGLLAFARRRGRLDGHSDEWWKRHHRQPERRCYRTKTAALQAFRDVNRAQIEEWGGLDQIDSPAEYDAINARHGLRGRRAVRSLSQALWASMPSRPPYCLDRLDLDTLNETSPGQRGSGFRLPDWAYDRDWKHQQREHYARLRPPRSEDLEPAPF